MNLHIRIAVLVADIVNKRKKYLMYTSALFAGINFTLPELAVLGAFVALFSTLSVQALSYVRLLEMAAIGGLELRSTSGLMKNEKNFNQCDSERRDSRSDGRWPATLRSGCRNSFTGTKEGQRLQR
jgi:hypothetical protein